MCCKHGGGKRCLVRECYAYAKSQMLCTQHRRIPVGDLDLTEDEKIQVGKPLLDYLRRTARLNNHSLQQETPLLDKREVSTALETLGDFGEGYFLYEEESQVVNSNGGTTVVPAGYYFFPKK